MEHLKRFYKFGLVGKSRSSEIKITMKILEKRKIKVEKKTKMKSLRFLCKIATALQILITKTLILSDYENMVFILTYKIFPKV